MERYFIVTEESSLHKAWFEYKGSVVAVNELVKVFQSDNGIESHEYYADDDSFYIVPTEKDSETFKTSLLKPLENGLQKFKKSSKIGKAWIQALKSAGLKVLRKPMVILYFRISGGRFSSRLFDQNGLLYCSLDPAIGEPPTGMIEMKASEFFKIIEESETVPV